MCVSRWWWGRGNMGSVILALLLHPVHFLPLREGGRLTAQALMFPPPCLLLVPTLLDIPLALYVTFTARLGSCSNHSSSSSFSRSSLHAGSVCTFLLPLNFFFFFSNMVMLLRGCLVFQLFCIPRNSSQEIDDPLNRSIMPYMQLIPPSISAVFYTQWALILSLVLIPKP